MFLNGVSYCDMFPPSNNSLNISGLAGGRNYKVHVEVYPKDKKNVMQESNSLVNLYSNYISILGIFWWKEPYLE